MQKPEISQWLIQTSRSLHSRPTYHRLIKASCSFPLADTHNENRVDPCLLFLKRLLSGTGGGLRSCRGTSTSASWHCMCTPGDTKVLMRLSHPICRTSSVIESLNSYHTLIATYSTQTYHQYLGRRWTLLVSARYASRW